MKKSLLIILVLVLFTSFVLAHIDVSKPYKLDETKEVMKCFKAPCFNTALGFIKVEDNETEVEDNETEIIDLVDENETEETVTCIFKDSTKEQECYSEFGSCKGIDSCSIDIKGKDLEEITWKSSCGGYAYTNLDSENENAEFSCKESIEASWECYDEMTIQAKNKIQLNEALWKEHAESFCTDHCNKDGTSCGLKTFSLI